MVVVVALDASGDASSLHGPGHWCQFDVQRKSRARHVGRRASPLHGSPSLFFVNLYPSVVCFCYR
jgi:hypothetical protein